MSELNYTGELLVDYCFGLTDETTTARLGKWSQEDEVLNEQIETIMALKEEGKSFDEILRIIAPPEVVDLRVKQPKSYSWLGWVAAAAAAVIITVSLFVAERSESPAQMALRYSKEVYPMLVERGELTLKDAYTLYDDGAFQEARQAFETGSSNETIDRFYSALSAFYSESYQKALIDFRVLANGDHGFADQSKWFLAVSALQVNNCQEAKAALKYLSERDGFRKQESANLLLGLVHYDCEEQAK